MTRRAAVCGELCRQHQARIAGQIRGCTKRAPLCGRVDPRVTALRPGETLDVYLDLMRAIALGHRRAEDLFANRPIPESADGWIALLLDAHRELFAGALPKLAGRLRTTDVYYGHHGHERKGAAPEEIESQLRIVYERHFGHGLTERLKDRGALCRWAACVLTDFFEIHPFDDGNGRLARLFISRVGAEAAGLTLRQSMNAKLKRRLKIVRARARPEARAEGILGYFEVRAEDVSRDRAILRRFFRTRYRKALQFAHSRSTSERWSPNWLTPLASWVDKMLVQTVEDEVEEPPPNSDVEP